MQMQYEAIRLNNETIGKALFVKRFKNCYRINQKTEKVLSTPGVGIKSIAIDWVTAKIFFTKI